MWEATYVGIYAVNFGLAYVEKSTWECRFKGYFLAGYLLYVQSYVGSIIYVEIA